MYSGAAPNLTNLMTRNTFAGATFDLLTPGVPRRACGTPRRRSSARATSRASPPSASTRSTCASGCATRRRRSRCTPTRPSSAATDGKTRGMPYLGLSEDQIDQLIAYLLERN